MTMKVEVVNADRTVAAIRGITPRMLLEVGKAIKSVSYMIEARTQRKLSGEVLHVVTGRLRRSISAKTVETETRVEGIVGTIGTNVEYAAIHEFGGTIPPYTAHSRSGKAYSHPGFQMPKRSFLRTSMREMLPTLQDKLSQIGIGG